MSDFEERSYATVEDFFLRRLRPGARPLSSGIVSPVDGLLVGAGTVMRPAQVDEAAAAGARFVVSPIFDTEVIRRSRELGLVVLWDDGDDEFAYQHPGGGRPLLELAPVPSWHELQFKQ